MGETAVEKNGIYRHHYGGESDTQTCQNNDCRALLPSFWGLTMNYSTERAQELPVSVALEHLGSAFKISP